MYSTKKSPTSEDEHQAMLDHFSTKRNYRTKLSDAERAALSTMMRNHPAKNHSPVGKNVS